MGGPSAKLCTIPSRVENRNGERSEGEMRAIVMTASENKLKLNDIVAVSSVISYLVAGGIS